MAFFRHVYRGPQPTNPRAVQSTELLSRSEPMRRFEVWGKKRMDSKRWSLDFLIVWLLQIAWLNCWNRQSKQISLVFTYKKERRCCSFASEVYFALRNHNQSMRSLSYVLSVIKVSEVLLMSCWVLEDTHQSRTGLDLPPVLSLAIAPSTFFE